MRTLKYILSYSLALLMVFSCTDDNNLDYLDNVVAPSNISALFQVTQDNTGLVTIIPNSTGAVKYNITLGDDTAEPEVVNQGQSVEHIYSEGTYSVTIEAIGITGLKSQVTKDLVVSFKAPENLVVEISNDLAVSKQVNVTATADFAVSFDVYFGEDGNDTPVSANNGDVVSYIYQTPGNYTIRVVSKSAAIATTEYVTDFEVTEILQPIASAPAQPGRLDGDVISIFSSKYTNVAGTNYFPDWGQGGQGSGWALFDLNGDEMLQYINLSYQGIALADGTSVDVSGMEFLHMDVWTSGDVARLETSLINNAGGNVTEKPVWSDLTAGEWTTIDIPISDYTDQGLTVSEIFQMKFVGDPWAAGTVFIDNIYFYKAASGIVTSMIEDFEGTAPTFTNFGNAAVQVISNPDASGINTSSNVAEFTKPSGAEVWAGSFFEVPSALDFITYSKIKVKTWSPKTGAVVKVKLENSDASITYEVDVNTTKSNSWETLVYDFSAAPVADYVRVVIFFDFGNAGDGSVYYYDEFQLESEGGIAPLVLESLEGTAPTFTNFGNAAVQVIDNPDATGENTSLKVAEFTKPSGAEVWAGSFFEIATPLDFLTYSKISVKTWSPKTGAVVKVKLENVDATITYEVDVNTTTANAWETLVYDFSAAPTADYVRIVIFFDFGNAGDGSVYYYDDFTLTN
ncbi:hypothetical protein V8G69_02450 [Gaetbulibacter sp. M235]|uniref:hypothetical protein n=1 Tax=Gaetbulibacter sp. M235 TaxID=3126510 RepID=UPI00374EAFAA